MAQTRKKFTKIQKIGQHFFVGSITAGTMEVFNSFLSDEEKDNPWITLAMFSPALMALRMLYENLLLVCYRREPYQRLSRATQLDYSSMLLKILERMGLKILFATPVAAFAVLDYKKIFIFKDPFFRNMGMYAFPAHIFSVLGEAILDFKCGSFFTGAYTANRIAAQVNFKSRSMQISENAIADLAPVAFNADSSVSWYQYVFRSIDNVVVAIAIAEIFLGNLFKESEFSKRLEEEPYAFITVATFAIFMANCFAFWAFSPKEEIIPQEEQGVDDSPHDQGLLGEKHEEDTSAHDAYMNQKNKDNMQDPFLEDGSVIVSVTRSENLSALSTHNLFSSSKHSIKPVMKKTDAISIEKNHFLRWTSLGDKVSSQSKREIKNRVDSEFNLIGIRNV